VKKIEIHWANHQELHPAGKISPAGGDRFHQLAAIVFTSWWRWFSPAGRH